MTLVHVSKLVATVGGAVLVAWQLVGTLDTALVKHLDATFATKADFARLEAKVDQLIQHMPPPKR